MKNVLVTGATGFVGRALVSRLRAEVGEGGRVIGLGSRDVDLVDRAATFGWFDRQHWAFECDHIIHLAALYKAGAWPVDHPATQFHVNMSMNVNVLEAWKRFFPSAKFTSILSYCMYPPHEDPHPETELWGTEPEEYLFAYAMTKKALLTGQKAYRQEYGLRCTSVVLPTIYGPHDSFAEDSHVMGALIGKFVRAQRGGADEVEIWGTGEQEREFLFVEDAVDGIVSAARGSLADVLNIGTGGVYSIREIAETIRLATGFTGAIRYNPTRFVGVKKRLLNVSRIREELGWEASTTLHAGVQRTVDWYSDRLDREASNISEPKAALSTV